MIPVYDSVPIIFTKDRNFLEIMKIHQTKMIPGSIVLLPEDAILVILPLLKVTNEGSSVEKIDRL